MDYQKILTLLEQTREIITDQQLAGKRKQKGPSDYVTQVDYAVQEFLKEQLHALHPDIGMFSEEQAENVFPLDRPVWILDPVDGTTNLIHHYGQCAVSLGLHMDGEYRFGAVYNPFTGELFWAARGQGAYLNGAPIHASSHSHASEALVGVGTAPYTKQHSERLFALMHEIFTDVQDIRRAGSAALELCYVAAGRMEAFYEPVLQPWDYAAGLVILEEAGARITAWNGAELPKGVPSDVLATNGPLHGYMTGKLRS